jgi:hypothetical protein
VTPVLKTLNWPPSYLTNQFTTRADVSKRSTRNSQNIDIPLFKSKTQRTFNYQAVSLWNLLNNDLKLCTSISGFKRSLKKQLFALCVVFVIDIVTDIVTDIVRETNIVMFLLQILLGSIILEDNLRICDVSAKGL